MKKIIRLTESDLTRLVKRVLKEQITIPTPATGEDPNYHRYDLGANMPGLEKFLANPLDDTITAELMSELKNDRYKKGKIVIIFNGAKYKEVESFIQKIQADARRNRCYTITDYNYNNRFIANTQITITATPGECKKAGQQNSQQPISGGGSQAGGGQAGGGQAGGGQAGGGQDGGGQDGGGSTTKNCKWDLKIPYLGETRFTEEEIKKFQRWCIAHKIQNSNIPDMKAWRKDYSDGTYQNCSAGATGTWGCCTATCWRHHSKDYYDFLNGQDNYNPPNILPK